MCFHPCRGKTIVFLNWKIQYLLEKNEEIFLKFSFFRHCLEDEDCKLINGRFINKNSVVNSLLSSSKFRMALKRFQVTPTLIFDQSIHLSS